MAKIMDPILPILSILEYWAIILGLFGGPGRYLLLGYLEPQGGGFEAPEYQASFSHFSMVSRFCESSLHCLDVYSKEFPMGHWYGPWGSFKGSELWAPIWKMV